jgi:hypothetical protein
VLHTRRRVEADEPSRGSQGADEGVCASSRLNQCATLAEEAQSLVIYAPLLLISFDA